MKNFKKFFAAILTAVMIFAMAVPAFAADITMTGAQKDHTYKAYQIFAGTVESGQISVTGWGEGFDGAGLLTALKADASPLKDAFKDVTTPAGAALAISQLNAAQMTAFAKIADDHKGTSAIDVNADESDAANGTYKWTDLDDGYYLILDETTGVDSKTDFISANIIRVAGENVTAAAKGSVPTSEKGVADYTGPIEVTTKITTNNTQANIGDRVVYSLDGVTSNNLDKYEKYEWTFNDTLPAGIAFYQIEKILVGGTEVAKADWTSKGITVTEPTTKATDAQAAGTADAPATGGGSLKVAFADVKTFLPADYNSDNAIELLVFYSAVVTQAATQGGTYDAMTNTMNAEFTNDPNGDGKGKTPDDKAVVYEVAIDLTKVSKSDTELKLQGAEFLLSRMKDGTKQYAVVDIATGKILRWDATKANGTTLTTDANGKLNIKGLESGQYTLTETKAPEGYAQPGENGWDTVFTITAVGKDADDAGLESLTLKIDQATANVPAEATDAKVDEDGNIECNGSIHLGQVAATLKNSNNITLPETGGIGTTIFYILGAALVIGAGIVLVTRRKMAAR